MQIQCADLQIGGTRQMTETYKLPPVTPHQEAKPGLPKKHVALLSSILESSSEAAFSPVVPPAPSKACPSAFIAVYL